MGNRRISEDLKAAAVRMKHKGGYSTNEILDIMQISRATLFRAAQRVRRGGSSKRQAIGRGRPRLLQISDAQYLLQLARHNPTLFLDEYRDRLHRYRHLPVSLSTIHRTLKRARLSIKRIQKMAFERDPIKRADFIRRIGVYPASYLLSIDEASKDDRTYARLWGRAHIGKRAEAHQPFVRKRRFSLVAALSPDNAIIGSKVVEGSFQRRTFLEFLRDSVLPYTTPFPGPRSVLILDNARIHHGPEIEELVSGYGCRIEYLPPYSPDFNPIEQAFSVIKSHLRRQGISFFQPAAPYYELYSACGIITPQMAAGFFMHSGYNV